MRKRFIPDLLALLCAAMTFALPVTAADGEGYSLTLHYYIDEQKRSISERSPYRRSM